MKETTPIGKFRGPVRITLPVSVAYDVKALRKGITNIVERLGCPRCFSGADCFFQSERDLVINEKFEVAARSRLAAQDPDGDPVLRHGYAVGMSKDVRYDLDKVLAAVEKTIGKLGHTMCFSGFDFAFMDELRVLVVNPQIEVQSFERM